MIGQGCSISSGKSMIGKGQVHCTLCGVSAMVIFLFLASPLLSCFGKVYFWYGY